jgi:hypothetical protein
MQMSQPSLSGPPRRPPPAVPPSALVSTDEDSARPDASATFAAPEYPTPPPLPPKPAFARAAALAPPPPLPPKPASARAPPVNPDLVIRPQRPVPSPPVGRAPEHYVAAAAAATSQPLPGHSRVLSRSTQDVTTLPTSSSSSMPLLASAAALLQAQATSVPLPFPAPPCVLREAGLSKLFARGRADSGDIVVPALKDIRPQSQQVEGAEFLAQSRADPSGISFPTTLASTAPSLRRAPGVAGAIPEISRVRPVHAGNYTGRQPGGEVWAIIDEILRPDSVSSPEWIGALESFVDLVVSAAIDSVDAGTGLLSEAVRRMREPTRPPSIQTAVFTLLYGVFAVHAALAATRAIAGLRNVERMIIAVLSDVVEDMASADEIAATVPSTQAHDTEVNANSATDIRVQSWEFAVQCAVAVLTGRDGSAGHSQRLQISSSSPSVSMRALIALARHVSADMHPFVERVLVGECVWRKFRGSFDEDDDVVRFDVDEDAIFGPHGGITTVIELYVKCRSLLARRRMFALIFEVAVSRVRSLPSQTGNTDNLVSEEQVNWLYGILWANDAGDALTSTFRLGPDPSFVMDTLRHVLFDPLSAISSVVGAADRISRMSVAFSQHVDDRREQRRRPSHFPKDVTIAGRENDCGMSAAATDHREAIVAAHRLLNKEFTLNTLMQLETMAKYFSKEARNRAYHPPIREYERLQGHTTAAKVAIEEIEVNAQSLRADGRSKKLRSTRQVWQILHASVCKLVRLNPSIALVITAVELVFSIILLPMPFSRVSSEGTSDFEAEAHLAGERRILGLASSTESAAMLVAMLQLCEPYSSARYVSEIRQALIEVLGSATVHSNHVRAFCDDRDAVVAHRARNLAGMSLCDYGGVASSAV